MALLRSIKQAAPEDVSIHCVIHHEAWVAKKVGNEEIINQLVLFPMLSKL